MKLYVVDAFTRRPFSGNPAGVALLREEPWPAEGDMQALAAELRHSETAFVAREGEGFRLRYFTPEGEVDLCGHATVAAFTALRERTGLPPGEYLARTRAGELRIGLEREAVWMDMAPPRVVRDFDEGEERELYAAYGLEPEARPAGWRAQAVSTGLADILLPVADFDTLQRAAQDGEAVTALSLRYDVVGVHMFWPSLDSSAVCHCRNFAPRYGIPEEAATGTSTGALTHYLRQRGVLPEGAVHRFLQGEKLGRSSTILSRLEGETIRVGGEAAMTMEIQLCQEGQA